MGVLASKDLWEFESRYKVFVATIEVVVLNVQFFTIPFSVGVMLTVPKYVLLQSYSVIFVAELSCFASLLKILLYP